MLNNDMLIAISSSGNSKNVIRACEECRKNGGHAITLSAILGTLNYRYYPGRCALKPIRLGLFLS
jgi:fructoselysine-6-P-deglycase FrlB-like protein